MISEFSCSVNDQRLGILDYDEKKTNARYRAVINEDKIAVLHLQTVDTEDTTVSQLSLCSGILESDVQQLFSSSSDINYLTQIFIEKVADNIVYR